VCVSGLWDVLVAITQLRLPRPIPQTRLGSSASKIQALWSLEHGLTITIPHSCPPQNVRQTAASASSSRPTSSSTLRKHMPLHPHVPRPAALHRIEHGEGPFSASLLLKLANECSYAQARLFLLLPSLILSTYFLL